VYRRAAALAFAIALAGSGVAAQEAADSAAAPPAPTAPEVTFQGGATAISEIHRNWTVNCNVRGTEKVCLLTQSLSNTANGQRLFTIEMRVAAPDRVEGGMLLPFGLNLNAGVSLALDDQPFGEKVAFTTCTQQGCFAPFAAAGDQLAALQSGETLKVGALNRAGDEPVVFAVSLAGFTSAMNRAIALPQ
jgi:invasion protein IalB